MKQTSPIILLTVAALSLAMAATAQTSAPPKDPLLKGFPYQDESLHYTINWPSGLSLGDANLNAHHTSTGWDFEVSVDAAIPGFAIKDKYQSSVTAALCSTEFRRDASHGGARKTKEKTTFDQEKHQAHRVTETSDGGTSDFPVPACARDAVAFVYFGRKELGQGRVPPSQQIFFGASYSAKMEYTGAQTIKVGDKQEVTDHLVATVKGPKADFTVEVFYARDAARTPLLIKVPIPVGALSMELVR